MSDPEDGATPARARLAPAERAKRPGPPLAATMDDRFDELAIRLGRAVSRREALRWIGSFVAGALLAPLSWRPLAWAQAGVSCVKWCNERYTAKSGQRAFCRFVCRQCRKTGREPCLDRSADPPVTFCLAGATACANGECCPSESPVCCGDGCCLPDRVCQDGQCVRCPSGQTACAGLECCAGACCPQPDGSFTCCDAGEVCQDGTCVLCPVDFQPCGDQCCTPPLVCQDGRCTLCETRICRSPASGRDVCCAPGELCTTAGCCPQEDFCLIVGERICCPAGTRCKPMGTAPSPPLVCCPEGRICGPLVETQTCCGAGEACCAVISRCYDPGALQCCPNSGPPGGVLCPVGTTCCVNATGIVTNCCFPGQACHPELGGRCV